MGASNAAGSGRIVNPLGGYEGGSIGGGINTSGTPNAHGHVQRQLIVNGEVLARYGDAPLREQPQSANNTHLKFDANTAEFHVGAFPLGLGGQAGVGAAAGSSALAARSHTVAEGESLSSIALSQYGDARLWFRIAQANALDVAPTAKLMAGQVLQVPAALAAGADAQGFRPYDPSIVIGDQSAALPAPPAAENGGGGGCGALGKIIMVVVAVVVAAKTGQFLNGSSFWGSLFGGAKGAATVATAATAAAAGSIASQVVGMGLGVQEGFSWKGVALSALSAGVGPGLGDWANLGTQPGSLPNAMVRSAVGNALTQASAVVLGLQPKFDWRGVAASAVGAGVGFAVGGALGLNTPAAQAAQAAENQNPGVLLAKRLATGLLAGTAAALARGGKVAIQQVATDAFGQVLGNGVMDAARAGDRTVVAGGGASGASASSSSSSSSGASASSDPLGDFIQENEQRRAYQDHLASEYNATIMAGAFEAGEDLTPSRQTAQRLGMLNFEGGTLAGADRAALSKSLQLGLSQNAALGLAPLIASVNGATGQSVDETFAFGGTVRLPRSSWTATDFAMLAPWAAMPTQRAAFESALTQTASTTAATNMAVLSAVRERLVDQLPALIQASRGDDQKLLTRMHSAMVNGLLATDVYFDTSIPQILPRGYSRMSAADLPSSLGLRSFEDPASGYFGALYRNADNGTFKYANRGTEGLDELDVRANILQAFGLESGQYARAIDVARRLQKTYGDQVSFTGHSLGGGLASAQALVTDLPATTFNAAGLNPETMRRVLGTSFDGAWARGSRLVSAYYVQGDPLSAMQDSARLPAGLGVRGRQIANSMAADPSLGFSAFKWSDKNLLLPAVEGSVALPAPARWVNPGTTATEPNVLSSAVGTRYALQPTAAPDWLRRQLGGVNPVPSGGALHSMATSVMYGLFGSVGRR